MFFLSMQFKDNIQYFSIEKAEIHLKKYVIIHPLYLHPTILYLLTTSLPPSLVTMDNSYLALHLGAIGFPLTPDASLSFTEM